MARGPIAEQIAGLTWFLTILGLVVYLLVLVLFVVPMWRRRRAAADEPDPHAGESVPAATANRWIVLGDVVLPVLVLPVTLAVSVTTMRDIPFEAPRGSLVVDVTGYRWWWSVHYPDHDVTLANEIRIPVGRPVELRLASTDVIHSFWVPKLAGKIDALPDRVNTLVIEADEPGEYEGACAEFCGRFGVAGLPHRRGRSVIAQVVGVVVGVALMAAPAVLGYAGSTASDVHRTIGPTAASLAFIAMWQATKGARLPNIVLGVVLAVSPVVVDHRADAAVVAVVAGAALVAATPFAGRERSRLGGGWRAAWPLHAERSNG